MTKHTIASAATAAEKSAVVAGAERLDNALTALHERLDWLSNQLTPVMNDNNPPVAPSAEPIYGDSPLVRRFNEQYVAVEQAIERIDNLRCRLEV